MTAFFLDLSGGVTKPPAPANFLKRLLRTLQDRLQTKLPKISRNKFSLTYSCYLNYLRCRMACLKSLPLKQLRLLQARRRCARRGGARLG